VYESFRQDHHDEETRKRYHRFNVRIDDGQPTPSLDDHGQMERLKRLGKKYCESDNTQLHLREVAKILVGSTFYFENKGWRKSSTDWVCQGTIHSRLSARRRETLSSLLTIKKLSFVVKTESPPRDGGDPEFETTTTVLAAAAPWPMQLEFKVSEAAKDRRICIELKFPDGYHCAISGFPRIIT